VRYFEEACNELECDCGRYHPSPDEYVDRKRVNYYPKPDILARIRVLETDLAEGKLDLAAYKASLKNEVVANEKDKIRVFFVGQMEMTIIIRMYLSAPLYAMGTNPAEFECACGIDPHSPAWQTLEERLASFNSDANAAGDYSNFDNSLIELLLRASYNAVHGLCEYDDVFANAVCEGITNNMVAPVYIFLGVILRADGSGPSGNPLTTYINSLVNMLANRYAYYRHFPDAVVGFHAAIGLIVYGDDLRAAIPAHLVDSGYDNRAMQRYFREIGMTYGPTDKTSDYLPPTYPVEEVTFLQRTTEVKPSLDNALVGVLSTTSIHKIFVYHQSSTTNADRFQAFHGALLLYFYVQLDKEGGRERYEALRNICQRAMEARFERDGIDVDNACFPDYDQQLVVARSNHNLSC
jgi:hypothetical protein